MNTGSKFVMLKALTAHVTQANTQMVFGLPLPQGQITQVNQLGLCQGGKRLQLESKSAANWPDGSIRWMRCEAIVPKSGQIDILGANAEQLEFHSKPVAAPVPVFTPALRVKLRGIEAYFEPALARYHSAVGDLSTTERFQTVLQHGSSELRFDLETRTSNVTGESERRLRMHNPNAAKHEGGRWDLGDPASCLIDDLQLVFDDTDTEYDLVVQDCESSQVDAVSAPFHLQQYGSGGQNWKSPIHWNEDKVSTVSAQGFSMSSGGEPISGLRAEPVVFVRQGEKQFATVLKHFWQNFPLALRSGDGQLVWHLLSQLTELQGGESKEWHFVSKSILASEAALDQMILARALLSKVEDHICYAPDYLNACQILPHIAFDEVPPDMQTLVDLGLDQNKGFIAKRERNDVYGWRHFGELHADHEAALDPGADYFISHYNNQYDPLMGLTLQYLQSGKADWLCLARASNRHLQDIDIYDTKDDKPEYNGGLFWHTDHYLPAETCTHRSNSRHHKEVYEGWLGGGGPGGQHCYTTGLMLQHFLFADEGAKKKALQLCDWIRNFYRGSGSIAERSFRFLTMDFKCNVITNIGRKAPGYRYPLDRGIGNYLVALMDAYELTAQPKLLEEMAEVIRWTCHPADNIAQRQFDNIEDTWFYTVFFQAVARYLFLKERLGSVDGDYWYARETLLHYGRWMLVNEKYYLDQPDILEFPNDTWCAQELRKANVLFFVYYFEASVDPAYLARAEQFYEYICMHLKTSDEAHYTRILALLMQNDGVWQKFRDAPRSTVAYQQHTFGEAPLYSKMRIFMHYVSDMVKLLLRFSPKREWFWIKGRVSQLRS